jgi:RNA polymerase sigma factor (sigma-70 family)
MLSEKELIAACLKGEPLAQKQLYEQYSRMLYGVCLRYARDNSEAQDMLQEGFIRIFKYLKNFEYKGNFEGWMKRIVVNVALRLIDSAAHKHEISPEIFPEYSTEAEIVPQLCAAEMLGYLRRLPQGYRTVFNLFALEDFSHAEIAKELGITESTSRSQLTKARQMLRQLITVEEKILI